MTKDDLLELAWGVIANAHGGDWKKADTRWLEPAGRFRDEYHQMLDRRNKPVLRESEPEVDTPRFNAVWDAIKGWDIERNSGEGLAGVTGDDVRAILAALDSSVDEWPKKVAGARVKLDALVACDSEARPAIVKKIREALGEFVQQTLPSWGTVVDGSFALVTPQASADESDTKDDDDGTTSPPHPSTQ